MQKLTKSTKFDKTNILDHGLKLLDTTTQSILIFGTQDMNSQSYPKMRTPTLYNDILLHALRQHQIKISLHQYQRLSSLRSYSPPRIFDSDSRFRHSNIFNNFYHYSQGSHDTVYSNPSLCRRPNINILRKGYLNRQLHSLPAALKHRNFFNSIF